MASQSLQTKSFQLMASMGSQTTIALDEERRAEGMYTGMSVAPDESLLLTNDSGEER